MRTPPTRMHVLRRIFQTLLNELRHRRVVRQAISLVLLLSAAICLAIAGYYAMYQMFFLGQGLDDIAMDRAEQPREDFKFEGVKWFHGTRLVPDDEEQSSTTFTVRSIEVVDESDAVLQLFVKLDGLEPGREEEVLATLQVVQQWGNEKTQENFRLRGVPLQRFQMHWPTDRFDDTRTTFRLKPRSESMPGAGVLIGTTLSVGLFGRVVGWGVPGIVLLLAWFAVSGSVRRPVVYLVFATMLLLGLFRAGAFISNDFFPETSGEVSIFRTAFGHMRKFERSGEWYPHAYKRLGSLAIPKLTLKLEPAAAKIPTDYYVDTYPTPRYLWFLMECVAVSVFVAGIWRYLAPAAACVYPFLHVIFLPFLFNIYNMEEDAMLVLLMLPLTALLLKVSRQRAVRGSDYAGFFLLMMLILLCKITAAFLIFLIPPGLYLAQRARGHRRAILSAAAVFVVLLSGAIAGNAINRITPPTGGEAQPGFPFHGHPLWDILWAANGLYDRDTAHPFIKVGRERDRIVAEAAGLPQEQSKRMRHAAIGDTLVYKPQLKAAFEERPGFFLNQAMIRFWSDGLMFFGYPHRGNYWRQDVVTLSRVPSPSTELDDDDDDDDGGGGAGAGGGGGGGGEDGGGEDALTTLRSQENAMGYRGRETPVLRSRFDEIWKIAPLIFVTSMFNFDQSDDRLLNLVLMVLALAGIASMRRPDLIFIFFSAIAVKIAFNTFVHGNIRYMDFVHVPLLLGHATLIAVAVCSLSSAARCACVRSEGADREAGDSFS